MSKKLIPKYQYSGKFEEKSDNTRTLNYSVPVVPKERYTPKVTLLQKYANKPQPQVQMSSDNRTEYLKKRGDDIGRDKQRQVREQKAKLQVGNIAALAGIAGAQLIPGLNTAVNIGLGLNSAAHLISDEGIKKTVGAINDGDYITAVQSGAGDLIDLGLIKLGTRSAKVAPSLLYSAGKWLYNKGFDAYHNTFGLGKPNGGFTKVVNNDGTINLRLPSHSSSTPRQLTIEPQGNNSFRVHVNTWGGVSPLEKQQLYEGLYNELPEGAKILFPESSPKYLATRGTVAGLKRLSRDSRYSPGITVLELLYKDEKTGDIKLFKGTDFTKKPTFNSISYTPNQQLSTGKTSLSFFEKPKSKITELERLGIPKENRNFVQRWHVANYPGYLLKGLMNGSLLERLLSKNGTISVNQLNAYFNKASLVEKEVANKVLAEKFAGLKTIDYNLFKKAVLDKLINYNTKPQMRYSTYGMDRLGFNTIKEPDGSGGVIEYLPGIRTNTFTFESPKIPVGSNKHYDITTLGHSRTYITPEEPKILHVMESLSDWSQEGIAKTNEAYRQKLINNPESYNKRINSLLRMNKELENWENMARTGINHADIKLQPYEIQQIQQEFIPRLRKKILNLKFKLEGNPLALYLSNNYLQRQLQENLKYAAENGLTKMRYPTPETAAKIEGYTPEPSLTFIELEKRIKDLKTAKPEPKYNSFEDFTKALREGKASIIETPEERLANLEKTIENKDLIELLENEKTLLIKSGKHLSYLPQHQTILKKYADFPKLFLKLYKGQNVRTVTDTKGNTWYEVDVPKGYLSREWLFKFGGKLIPKQ